MPSFKSTFLAVAAAFVATAQADYWIEPTSVALSIRKSWCANEKYTCPIICEQVSTDKVQVNDCDPETLTYGCICGNGQQPNMTEYSLTLPFFVCQEYGNQCVKGCGLANNQCSSDCREKNPCGAQDPERLNTTTSTATGTATATATSSQTSGAVFSGFAGGDSSGSSSGSGSGAASLEMGRGAGAAILVGSLLGGIAFLL